MLHRGRGVYVSRGLRPVGITFLRYNFSVAAVFAVICNKTMANGQLSLLKSYPNWPYDDHLLIACRPLLAADGGYCSC